MLLCFIYLFKSKSNRNLKNNLMLWLVCSLILKLIKLFNLDMDS